MQHKKSSEIIRENLTYMLNQEGTPSMRNLSTSFHAKSQYQYWYFRQLHPKNSQQKDYTISG